MAASDTRLFGDDQDLLDPRVVPRGPNTGVRRVNGLPLLIIGVGVITFCLLIGLAMLDRASASRRTVAETQAPGGADSGTPRTTGLPAVLSQAPSGIISADPADPPQPTRADVTTSAGAGPGSPSTKTDSHSTSPHTPQVEPATPPVPAPSGPILARPTSDVVLEQERAARALEERLRAFAERAKASSVMPFATERAAASVPVPLASPRDDLSSQLTELQRTLDQSSAEEGAVVARLRGLANPAPPTSAATTSVAVTSPTAVDAASAQGGSADRWRLESSWEPPRSPYELRAGAVIPALALTAIRSELPGQVMAQTTTDIYDTATGRYLLIPQGTRLIGRYAADVGYGQKTLYVAWQRMVRPDGLTLALGSMPAAQPSGTSGLSDQVDNHYLRLFGSALLLSGVTAGITYATQPDTPAASARGSAKETVSEALGQQLGQVTAQLLVKNMNVSPTLEIRPGFRFVVLVTKDIDFASAPEHSSPRRSP